ncbi:hypothetical protein EYB26_005202 [Talaromyces marneffei]|nr:uncharacterized protein EYB26_005202 [Talaromyces marneffei]QGA17531.1 hypothetical protein EYB26_005202 [Talaromyces marneffei]
MKLLTSLQLSVRRAAQRQILYELSNSQLTHQPPATSICPHRPFSTTTSNLSKHNHSTPPPPPLSQQQTESSISHKIRLLMRCIPHPVAIVTASSPSPTTNQKPIPRGMTVSSFNTVTLHPKPIITFNVRQPSETLAAIQSSGRFLVHLLAPTASMARLARNFSRGNVNVDLDRFEYIEHGEMDNNGGSTILPQLIRRRINNNDNDNETICDDNKLEEDFTFILECEYLPEKSVQVYDHMIVLGNVKRIIAPGPNALDEGKRHTREDFCLMYADTRFWGMGEETS